MNRTYPNKQILILGLLLSVVLFSGPLIARDQSPGRWTFEQAYKYEENSPQVAILLYQRALHLGLESEIKSAARWRLFYLYRSTGDFKAAFDMGAALGNTSQIRRLIGETEQEAASYLQVSPAEARKFYNADAALQRQRSGEVAGRNVTVLLELHRAHPDRLRLRREILRALTEARQTSAALQIVDTLTGTEHILEKADLFISLERTAAARELLRDLAADSDVQLSNAEKGRTLYLLARSHREDEDHLTAARYYRLAARYAEAAQAVRLQSLAAFSLFQGGLAPAALGLIRHTDDGRNENIHLLALFLRAVVEGDRQAYNELLEQRPILLEKKRQSITPYLVERALRIIE
ncbi:MAG: hypothetical protein KDK34_25005 [Leptospiraceae bacterium]|nr:hypothetical protein [Leptospiraceae bacterium]